MTDATEPAYDVAVLGGGPAGSTRRATWPRPAVKVVLIESAVHPREHVGESLVPATTPVLLEIGAMPAVEAANFPRSTVRPGPPRRPGPSTTGLHRPAPRLPRRGDLCSASATSPASTMTLHLPRGPRQVRPDPAQERRGLGADVLQGVRVQGRRLRRPRPVVPAGWRRGAKASTPVRMMVDASGRRTLLGSQLKVQGHRPGVQPVRHPHVVRRLRPQCASRPSRTRPTTSSSTSCPISNTWCWQIPITDTVTAIGVVTQKKRFAAAKDDREKFFWDTVAARPDLLEALKNAEQVRPFKAEGDYSYGDDADHAATASCWSATPRASSTRSSPPASASP